VPNSYCDWGWSPSIIHGSATTHTTVIMVHSPILAQVFDAFEAKKSQSHVHANNLRFSCLEIPQQPLEEPNNFNLISCGFCFVFPAAHGSKL